MQFSDTSNKLGLIQACEKYCNLGDATISGTAQDLKEFTANINEHLRRVWHTIFSAYGGWQYDDANQSDLPAATATLTADQTSYALPTNAITVRGVEVKNGGSTWYALKPITEEKIREYSAMGDFLKTSAQPQYYQLVGQTIRIYPASNYTQASSFKVFFDRGSVAFASTDTTATPGFASEYHNVLALGASMDWYMYKLPTSTTLPLITQKYERMMADIRYFYQLRFQEAFPARVTVRDAMRENI